MATTKEKAPKTGGTPKAGKDKAAPGATDAAPKAAEGTPRLQTYYETVVRGRLAKQFGITNPMQVPRIVKVVLNVGMGEASKTPKLLDAVVIELGQITGQKPVVTRAKKSIANFGLRAGVPVGASVTLRGARMYEFLDRLITIALPRVRDFRGVSAKGFDGRGNFTLGLRDQLIFPEIDYMKVDKGRGMNISVVTTARTDQEARRLLQLMGMPFKAN